MTSNRISFAHTKNLTIRVLCKTREVVTRTFARVRLWVQDI